MSWKEEIHSSSFFQKKTPFQKTMKIMNPHLGLPSTSGLTPVIIINIVGHTIELISILTHIFLTSKVQVVDYNDSTRMRRVRI